MVCQLDVPAWCTNLVYQPPGVSAAWCTSLMFLLGLPALCTSLVYQPGVPTWCTRLVNQPGEPAWCTSLVYLSGVPTWCISLVYQSGVTAWCTCLVYQSNALVKYSTRRSFRTLVRLHVERERAERTRYTVLFPAPSLATVNALSLSVLLSCYPTPYRVRES